MSIHARIIDRGPFTAKEAEVLRYMCEGLYTTEIALRLFRSPRTISKHIENIAHKLDAHGSSEIVLIAREMGWVEITLTHTWQNLLKVLLLSFICNSLFIQNDLRSAPRPKIRNPVSRLARLFD